MAAISDDGKELVCTALNPGISQPVTSVFLLNVLYPPEKPRVEGHREQVIAGETLDLVCTSRRGNPLATLQWVKEDVVLSRVWETDVLTRSSRSVLSYVTEPQDNGVRLSCEALNEVTRTPLTTVITLHVLFPPRSVLILGSPSVFEGHPLVLSCVSSHSNPAAQLRWYGNGKELNGFELSHMEGGREGVTTMSNVTIVTTRHDNGMTVVCEAVNQALFISQSASVIISVYYPPERIWIQGPPQDSSFLPGSEVTLSCFTSGGNPLAQLLWTKDAKVLPHGLSQRTGNLAVSTLTITADASDNLAVYQCRARNPATQTPLTAHTSIRVQCE
ncbi:nephrin [Chiloscyllium punctatum]|uniref:nephrin n=1 Tax=Chiloscyllium punctatum TaxID=137246 RepID=UPI003B638B93